VSLFSKLKFSKITDNHQCKIHRAGQDRRESERRTRRGEKKDFKRF
jgi:hypothetical protein